MEVLERGLESLQSEVKNLKIDPRAKLSKRKFKFQVAEFRMKKNISSTEGSRIQDVKAQIRLLEESSTFNGEGNGTPLQYPCLENPMDGGVW